MSAGQTIPHSRPGVISPAEPVHYRLVTKRHSVVNLHMEINASLAVAIEARYRRPIPPPSSGWAWGL